MVTWTADEDLLLVGAGGFGRFVVSNDPELTWANYFAPNDGVSDGFRVATPWSAPPSADGSTANNFLGFLNFRFKKGTKFFLSPENTYCTAVLFFLTSADNFSLPAKGIS
jgi:hypothetical protein